MRAILYINSVIFGAWHQFNTHTIGSGWLELDSADHSPTNSTKIYKNKFNTESIG